MTKDIDVLFRVWVACLAVMAFLLAAFTFAGSVQLLDGGTRKPITWVWLDQTFPEFFPEPMVWLRAHRPSDAPY